MALARPSLALHWLSTGTLQALSPITVPAANPYLLVPHARGGAAGLFADWLRALCAASAARSAAWLSGLA